MLKKITPLFILLLMINIAQAATIHGTVYSFDLEKKLDSIVTVNSNPPQTIVAKDATYSFELPLGEYIIKASYEQETAEETIKIAITKGIKPTGEQLDEEMPGWNMSENDLNDLIDFLKTLQSNYSAPNSPAATYLFPSFGDCD